MCVTVCGKKNVCVCAWSSGCTYNFSKRHKVNTLYHSMRSPSCHLSVCVKTLSRMMCELTLHVISKVVTFFFFALCMCMYICLGVCGCCVRAYTHMCICVSAGGEMHDHHN